MLHRVDRVFLHRVGFAQRLPWPDRCRTGSRSARRRWTARCTRSCVQRDRLRRRVVGVGAHHLPAGVRAARPAARRAAARRSRHAVVARAPTGRARRSLRDAASRRSSPARRSRHGPRSSPAACRRSIARPAGPARCRRACRRRAPSSLTTRSGIGGAARKISPPAHSSTANEAISRAPSPSHSFRVLLMAISMIWTAHVRRCARVAARH